MKRNLLFILIGFAVFVSGFSQKNLANEVHVAGKSLMRTEEKITIKTNKVTFNRTKPDKKIKALRKQHSKFLAKSPFKKTLQLSKKQRNENGIPPNKYYENEWELTMSPNLGRPTPENLALVRKKLEKERSKTLINGRVPGDANTNSWVERGPTNVGGRTRAIMYDPNDATNETVFAGGVSGGLWKNTNISRSNSTWTRVNIPENLAVSCITSDPNNTNIFYVGTGESYVGGDVNGDGVWKSIDKGVTWTKVFGGITGPTFFQSPSSITINSPIGIAGYYVNYPTTGFGSLVGAPITENIVLINDGSGSPTLGCNAITNAAALNGKIALIRRGSCTFVIKVKAAQDAGAIAVIMMNNVDGQPIPMGGSDPAITIPSVMISKADGDVLENALSSGSINGTLNPAIPGIFTGNLVPGIQHINDIKIRNNRGVSEIFVAAGESFYSDANAFTSLGGNSYGLYKSTNGGLNWTEIALQLTANGNKHCPNDIAIGSNNKIWVSTTKSIVFGDGGGVVFSSTDGTNFNQNYQVVDGARTQIAVSSTTPDMAYVLAELSSGGVSMIGTTTGFTNTTVLSLPDDADTAITPEDFTRGQAFYDLLLEVDPGNDQILYAGGIDLFRSTSGGLVWTQISKWSNNNNLAALNCSLVHADHHAMTFKPGNNNIALFGNDGGVYYASNLSGSATSQTITPRISGFNVTQFYSLAVAPTSVISGLTGDYFLAGAQDNGTQNFVAAANTINTSVSVQGGDGAYCFFDQGGDKYFITNGTNNSNISYRTSASPLTTRVINSETTENGAFISPMALDSSLDLLFSDYTSATPVFQIRRYSNLKSGVVGKTILTNALLTNSPTALTVSKYTTASTTLLVGTRGGRILKLTNADATPTWSDITGPGFVGSVSDVEFGNSENEIFVTFHNYNVINIWYSNDGGVTWQNKEGNFPDIPVKSILQNPLNTSEVIIGTELGVWYTNTFNIASPVWKQSYNGMSNVKVTDMDVRNDNAVYASTYGRGVFSGIFTNASLSVNDVAITASSVKVFPNPSNGQINISSTQFTGKISIQVADLLGRIVYDKTEENFISEKSIDLSQLQKGVYIIKLSNETINQSEKIIIE